jgi:hypothetical protein
MTRGSAHAIGCQLPSPPPLLLHLRTIQRIPSTTAHEPKTPGKCPGQYYVVDRPVECKTVCVFSRDRPSLSFSPSRPLRFASHYHALFGNLLCWSGTFHIIFYHSLIHHLVHIYPSRVLLSALQTLTKLSPHPHQTPTQHPQFPKWPSSLSSSPAPWPSAPSPSPSPPATALALAPALAPSPPPSSRPPTAP